MKLENIIEPILMQKKDLVRVFVKGGILSPGDFYKIICTAHSLGTDFIHLGSRQDILFPLRDKNLGELRKTFEGISTDYDTDGEEYQNIVSSYVALDVMPSTSWLASHIYHYVLDTFDYRPRLKINITDPAQSMVPLFTGNLNFVASPTDNFWYLYFRFREIDSKPWCCPDLIYGFDLAKVARTLEEMRPSASGLGYAEIYQQLKEKVKFHTQPVTTPLEYPDTTFPYYEGLNRIAGDKYWLGVYWRNNKFTISFLKALCQLCLQTNIGKISLTPWKSFIVKGITEKDRIVWEKLLGKWGINIRHSSLELNWHLPVLDKEALELKTYLVRALDQQDISTYGLTFTVKTMKSPVLFTSVVVEKNKPDPENLPDTYNIMYSKEFNSNLMEYTYYARKVPKEIIPALLIELSKKYYDQLEAHKPHAENGITQKSRAISTTKALYQCENCLTIYDEAYGDETASISANTAFDQLPETYVCPVCGSAKSSYHLVQQSEN